MRKINSLGVIILFSILLALTACSKEGFPYPEDLPEKGWHSIIIIHANDDKMEKPEFLSDHIDKNIYKINQVYYEGIDDVYPKLNIENAPYYIFLDYKGIAFETSNLEKARTFYIKDVKERTE